MKKYIYISVSPKTYYFIKQQSKNLNLTTTKYIWYVLRMHDWEKMNIKEDPFFKTENRKILLSNLNGEQKEKFIRIALKKNVPLAALLRSILYTHSQKS